MRAPVAIVSLLSLVLAACTAPPPSAQSGLPASGSVTVRVVGDAPAFEPGEETGYGFMLPGAGAMADGVTHAWVIGFGEQQGDQELMHLTSSTDGTDWQIEGRRLEEELGIELEPPGPIPTTVMPPADPGGDWVMYLSGDLEIWRATAPSADGPWTADPEPVLARADAPAEGGTDPFQLDFPAVVRTEDGYLMLFGWSPTRATTVIRSATSSDGISWTVSEEPAVDLGLCGGFDARSVAMPRVWPDPDGGWLALYGAFGDDAYESMVVALARSPDGGAWTCGSTEPVLDVPDIPRSTRIHSYALLASDAAAPRLLVESLVSERSELWLAELQLD
jgi:hypothetical protein